MGFAERDGFDAVPVATDNEDPNLLLSGGSDTIFPSKQNCSWPPTQSRRSDGCAADRHTLPHLKRPTAQMSNGTFFEILLHNWHRTSEEAVIVSHWSFITIV
jgi:hypothetical protein